MSPQWFVASEQLMSNMPRQGSDKPVRGLPCHL